jgi:hypothetical protein
VLNKTEKGQSMKNFRVVATVPESELGTVMAVILERAAVIACELITVVDVAATAKKLAKLGPKPKGKSKAGEITTAVFELIPTDGVITRAEVVRLTDAMGYRRNQVDGALSKLVNQNGTVLRPMPGTYTRQGLHKPGAVTPMSEAETAAFLAGAPVKVVR